MLAAPLSIKESCKKSRAKRVTYFSIVPSSVPAANEITKDDSEHFALLALHRMHVYKLYL